MIKEWDRSSRQTVSLLPQPFPEDWVVFKKMADDDDDERPIKKIFVFLSCILFHYAHALRFGFLANTPLPSPIKAVEFEFEFESEPTLISQFVSFYLSPPCYRQDTDPRVSNNKFARYNAHS